MAAEKVAEVKIDRETLESQEGNLTEEQADAIANEALKEDNEKDENEEDDVTEEPEKKEDEKEEKPAPEKKEEEEDTGLSDEELLSAEDNDLDDDQKVKKEELVKAKETQDEKDRLLSAKEEDLSEEDKTKKAEIVKAEDTVKEEAFNAEVKTYAEEAKIPEDQAREELESIAKIQEKYKGDPKQLAKANLHLQRLHAKTEADAKAAQDAKPEPVHEVTAEAVEKAIEDGVLNLGGIKITREESIARYRNTYPKRAEDFDDDAVYALAIEKFVQHMNKTVVAEKVEVSKQARSKRETVFDSVAEADKQFVAAAKPLVEKVSDAQIVNEAFDVGIYITHAKGLAFDEKTKTFEQDKKEFGEKEFQRGLSEAKIAGVKVPPGGGKPPSKKGSGLTDVQKERAEAMYDNPLISKAEAHKMYAQDLADEKKEDEARNK